MNNFSIIIPIFNEEENINKLVQEIYLSLNNYKNFELILVDDCSTDNSQKIIIDLKKNYDIVFVKNEKNYGQSYSIRAGALKATNNVIITLDADGQNNPSDIPKILDIYNSDVNFFLVGGIRKNRKDSIIKIISSKLANKFRNFIC